jgi:hypothetical protein
VGKGDGRWGISKTVFLNLFSPTAHPNLLKTHGGKVQNVATEQGYNIVNSYKYVPTYKYVSYKKAGVLKQYVFNETIAKYLCV